MIFNSEGVPIKMIGTTLDITELSNLKESNKELNNIVEHASSEIYIIDRETYSYKYVNHKATQVLGYSFDEMLEMSIFDINPTITMEKIDFLKKEIDHKGHVLNRTIHKKRDGTLYHVQSYIHYTQYMGEDVAIAFDFDITELIEAEKKEQHQTLILEQIHDSVITTNLDGIITQWNNGATQLHGYTLKEALGRSFHMLYPESSQKLLQDVVLKTLEGGSCKQDIQMVTKMGMLIETESSFSVLKDDNEPTAQSQLTQISHFLNISNV
jgi:PAS domain S-box-containing protein